MRYSRKRFPFHRPLSSGPRLATVLTGATFALPSICARPALGEVDRALPTASVAFQTTVSTTPSDATRLAFPSFLVSAHRLTFQRAKRDERLECNAVAFILPSRPPPCEHPADVRRGSPCEPPLSLAADCVQYSHRSVTGAGAGIGGILATLVLSPLPPWNEGLFRAAIMMGSPV